MKIHGLRTPPPPPPEPPPGAEALVPDLDDLASTPEFSAFERHHDLLVRSVLSVDGAELLDQRQQQDDELRVLAAAADAARSRTRRRSDLHRFVGGAAWLVAGACAVVVVLDWIGWFPWEIAWLDSTWRRAGALVLLVVLAGALVEALDPYSGSGTTSPEVDLIAARREVRTARGIELAEAYRRAINRELADLGLTEFPGRAPNLVELGDTGPVSSRSITYVRGFVADHTTSAIGIAGPRGSGKSTLINAVCSSAEVLRAVVPSAGRSDETEILRRITFALERSVGNATTAQRHGQSRGFAGVVLASCGVLLVLAEFLAPRAVLEMSMLGKAGTALVVLGLLIQVVAQERWSRSMRLADEDRVSAPGTHLVQALARDLRVEIAEETDSRASVGLGSWLGVERGRTETGTHRAMGYADLLDRLVDALTALGQEMELQKKKVVVAIDELDKAADTASLLAAVNAIKDLFRIRNVHFLVSVSDEALRSFQLRGMQPRDAFDSSFDLIVEIERITSDEAIELVNSRVTFFPPQLTRVCHVWSGGLPRDLFRAVRACIEVHAAEARPWPEVARAWLCDDIDRRVRAIRQQGLIVSDEHIREMKAHIKGEQPQQDSLGMNLMPHPGLPLRGCLILARETGSAIRIVMGRESLPAHGVVQLDLGAETVGALAEPAPHAIATATPIRHEP